MDEHLSITGRPITRFEITREDRGRLWVLLYPLVALPGALREHDWIASTYWVLTLAGWAALYRYGQPAKSRTRMQKIVLVALLIASALLTIVPVTRSPMWRAVGIAITPLPFLIDVSLARRKAHATSSGWH